MTIVDFKDDGCTVYILMLEGVARAIGIGVMDGRTIQYFPEIECAFEQIANDARENKTRPDENLDKYKIMFFTTMFTHSFNCSPKCFNVVEYDRTKWEREYRCWVDQHRSKRAYVQHLLDFFLEKC